MPPASPQTATPRLSRQLMWLSAAFALSLLLPAVIEASGLTRLVDAWLADVLGLQPASRHAGPWVRALLHVAVVGLTCAMLPLMSSARVALVAGALSLAVLLAEAILRWRAGLAIGPTVPILGTAMVAAIGLACERYHARIGLRQLHGWLSAQIAGHEGEGGQECREALFNSHFDEIIRGYVDCQSSILAELPPGRWHLRVRGLVDTTEGEIDEQRRDIRRTPYRDPFTSLQPAWAEGLMTHELGVRSLLVPLHVGGRPVGLWIVNVSPDMVIDQRWDAMVRHVAGWLSAALAPEQVESLEPHPRWLSRLVLPEGVPEIREVTRLAEELAAVPRWLSGMVQGAPVGLLAASLWGEIRFANRQMREAALMEGLADPLHQPLEPLLARLVGQPLRAVHERVRQVLASDEPWRVALPHADCVLTRCELAGDGGDVCLLLTWVPHPVTAPTLGAVPELL